MDNAYDLRRVRRCLRRHGITARIGVVSGEHPGRLRCVVRRTIS